MALNFLNASSASLCFISKLNLLSHLVLFKIRRDEAASGDRDLFASKKDELHWSDMESPRVEETFDIKSNHQLIIITVTPKLHPPAPYPDTS